MYYGWRRPRVAAAAEGGWLAIEWSEFARFVFVCFVADREFGKSGGECGPVPGVSCITPTVEGAQESRELWVIQAFC
jgi:hypothetical protein